MEIKTLPFIHKDLTFALKSTEKLIGIRVKGFSGDIHVLADSFMANNGNKEKIKKDMSDLGANIENIEEFEEVISINTIDVEKEAQSI